MDINDLHTAYIGCAVCMTLWLTEILWVSVLHRDVSGWLLYERPGWTSYFTMFYHGTVYLLPDIFNAVRYNVSTHLQQVSWAFLCFSKCFTYLDVGDSLQKRVIVHGVSRHTHSFCSEERNKHHHLDYVRMLVVWSFYRAIIYAWNNYN